MDVTILVGVESMTVYNRFAVLLAEKRISDKTKRIPLADVAQATGITERTLQSWNSNEVTRYDAKVIEALCKYFGCQVGDLIVYKPEERPADTH